VRRLLLPLLAVALLAGGCGNERTLRTQGETEGIYIDLGTLKYQVQISRLLNPADGEDAAYLRGLPAGTEPPAADEAWFGVWLRVQNVGDEPQRSADTFEIHDSDEREYPALLLDPDANPFAYQPTLIPGPGIYPPPESPAAQGPIQGSLLLFKVGVQTLQNRPLEFIIRAAQAESEGVIALDV
jgi:hypothetical protein